MNKKLHKQKLETHISHVTEVELHIITDLLERVIFPNPVGTLIQV